MGGRRIAMHLFKGSFWVVGGCAAISTTSHPAFGASHPPSRHARLLPWRECPARPVALQRAHGVGQCAARCVACAGPLAMAYRIAHLARHRAGALRHLTPGLLGLS